MRKFKVGDYVIPNEGANMYSFTGTGMILGEVVELNVEDDVRDIVVKVLKHEEGAYSEGRAYPVKSRHFDLLTEETLFDMMIRGEINESNYETKMKLINNT